MDKVDYDCYIDPVFHAAVRMTVMRELWEQTKIRRTIRTELWRESHGQ